MKIINIKKINKNKYRLKFDNNDTIDLYEDIVINNLLLANKAIDGALFAKIKKQNYEAAGYYHALKYITARQRSKKEVHDYLKRKEYEEPLIEEVVLRLSKEGYIDDTKFAAAFINDRLALSKDGPNKIRMDLERHGVDDDVISNLIENIDSNIIANKIKKIIDKKVKANHRYSGFILKKKILDNLSTLGYDRDIILEYLNSINLNNNQDLQKEYDKLYQKYSKKYEGYKLDMMIKQKLYQKGYNNLEDIIE